jgi:hypothetical protein
MAKRSIDVPAEVARLRQLTTFELRSEWQNLHRVLPPIQLSRDLLVRGIAYKLQERSLGGLSQSLQRKIRAAPVDSKRQARAPAALKPGVRLVREWRGVTHTVLVLDDGVEWRGRRYRSLSIVAREITGAHWSGPRFFGLTSRQGASDG